MVAAVECAIAIQKLMTEPNAGTPEDKRIHYRIGVNLSDVLIEDDGILATASTSLRGSKAFASPAAFSFWAPRTNTCGDGSGALPRSRREDLKNIARPVRVYAIGTGLEGPASAPLVPERSATGLREADLNVFSKLGKQGLEWRLEPEAFAGREVGREDDLLDVLVGCAVDIEVARQPST